MPYKLSYTALLQQTDNYGNPAGDTFTFTGKQVLSTNNPQSSDFSAATTAMAADISAQLTSQFPIQLAQDSSNGSTGGGD